MWKQYAELSEGHVECVKSRFRNIREAHRKMSKAVGIEKNREIRVGISVATSGRFQLLARQALNAMLLWRSYINSRGGIPVGNASRSVQLIWYDDESRADRTRENILRLLRNDRVDILFGPYSSNLTLVAAEISEEHNTLLWNYGGTSDEIFDKRWQHIVGIPSPASDYFRALPAWLAKEYPKLRRICVLYSTKGTFGRQINRGVGESAQATGHLVHSMPVNTEFGNSDAALSMLHEINPQAVVLAGSFQGELAIMRTRLHWPNTVRVIAAVAAGISSFGCQLGQTSHGVLGPSQWEPGVNFPESIGPSSDWFENSFREEFGTEPDYIAAGAFATGLIVGECIRRAASLDSDELRCVASQLDCNTLYGRFRIDPENGKQRGHRILLVRWQKCTKTVLPA